MNNIQSNLLKHRTCPRQMQSFFRPSWISPLTLITAGNECLGVLITALPIVSVRDFPVSALSSFMSAFIMQFFQDPRSFLERVYDYAIRDVLTSHQIQLLAHYSM